MAPWCGHCKRLAPDWDKLAEDTAGKGVVIGKVDCTVESDLCSTYGVQGYPTLKYWTKGAGKPEEYNGGRSYDERDFVDEHLGGGAMCRRRRGAMRRLVSTLTR
eukprot:Sspe_Gene.49057::Locus_26071_Transcript_1_5_Confidence_0.556_Length_656::g.49057::m.49057